MNNSHHFRYILQLWLEKIHNTNIIFPFQSKKIENIHLNPINWYRFKYQVIPCLADLVPGTPGSRSCWPLRWWRIAAAPGGDDSDFLAPKKWRSSAISVTEIGVFMDFEDVWCIEQNTQKLKVTMKLNWIVRTRPDVSVIQQHFMKQPGWSTMIIFPK